MLRLCIALTLAVMTAACATTCPDLPPQAPVIRERLVVAAPDEALRRCIARLARPDLRDSADEAVLIARLDERGEDCSSKLGATWRSIDDARARADAANAMSAEP